MKTSTLSLAVLLLIGDIQAAKLNKNFVQFGGDNEDPLTENMSQQQETEQSIADAEKQYGKEMKLDKDTMSASFDKHSKFHFASDGNTIAKIGSITENNLIQQEATYQMTPNGGVWLVQSDPIHGSLGEPKAKMEDLTAEQQFEQFLRNKKPQVFKDDKENVTWTDESIKWAEENTGGRMPEPSDPKQKKKVKKTPKYHLADSDDEDEDTVETRKSVKMAEKKLQHRFFINAREKIDYEKAVASGQISQQQMNFKEGYDEELGPIVDKSASEAAKVDRQVEALKQKQQSKVKTPKQNKEEQEKQDKEDAIAESKQNTAANAPPQPKVVEPLEENDDEGIPELKGLLGDKLKLVQQSRRIAAESQSDDEESSDSESDEE